MHASIIVIDIRTPSIFGRAIFVTKQAIILIAPGYQTLRSLHNTLPTHSIKIVVQMVSCPHQIYKTFFGQPIILKILDI